SGISQWGVNGICICNAVGNQTHHKIIADGLGGAIITWDDERDGRHDIYAQRIDGDGNIHSGWDLNGVLVCDITNSGFTGIHPQIVTDSLEGTIITWRDLRNPDNNGDIYAQRITSEVSVGFDDTEYQIRVKLYQNYPNPFNPKTIISYSLPKASNVKIMIYNIKGQLVETLVDAQKPAGSHTVDWNVEDMSSGIYFYKLKSGNYNETKKMLLLK
ncbi:MAG: T9SS type A sorting domain-containing protein, partial [Candidatus Cloacimonetes bacterium]|nr:T9SS type A sorting domain-containing protein [Candidatus Cloacimonadota bacterium]